jgi:nitrogen regulatory protein PII
MADFSLICCVVNLGTASRVLKEAKKYGVHGGTISIGRGTVHSRLLDFLKLNEERKEVVSMVVERELASAAIKGIADAIEFHKPHHGIAFMIPVSEFTGHKNRVEKEAGSNEMKDETKNMEYKVIHVVVDRGRAEDVVEAAEKAGAAGGTIINARGAGIHEIKKVFSVEIEPEKEEVFIIAKADIKDRIVDSVREFLQLDKPGNGVLFVLDVEEVYGIHGS